MLSEQRHKEILQLLETEGTVKASSLCKLLDTSRETIRRDLENLEEKGKLRRIHGGAMRLEPEHERAAVYEPFEKRTRENSSYKEEVAFEAVHYISEGQAIALDSGTTSLELARAIKNRFRSLTVVTNSLTIANELADAAGITLILTGGIYNPEEKAFLSDMATMILSRINIDILFLTTCGISVERGITYQRTDDLIIQSKLMEASDKTIVITDSSKLGTNSLVRMCGIEEISMIITDSHASEKNMQTFEKAGIKVVISQKRKEEHYGTNE
ncbi:MAG: DeoR/GlpR family DNA-binding transcription regulator [Brotaphodocola sp.]